MEEVTDYTGKGRLLRVSGGRGAPVLISHGTFSTAETCLPLAQQIGAGRPTYIIEWRGRDIGPGRVQAFDYTALGDGEMAQAIAYVSQRHGPVHLVAHSGGGLAMALALARHDLRAQVRSLCVMGAQATRFYDAPWRFRMTMLAVALVGRRRGYWPVRLINIGPCNEASGIMDEWLRWNRVRVIADDTGPLAPRLAALHLPTLVLAGGGDRLIAPVEGCRDFAQMFGPRAQLELCGTATGYSENFNHARMIRSRAAATGLWPRIADWLADHDAGVDQRPPSAYAIREAGGTA
ncbi:alpha/beta hydrolase [Pseudosulfitobacter koreensis]|uniref:Alpha/beta hydrolase n=1 Tax=Pseudosulfitobacter koreensis TaxID=2968472 RepID=A0ABT1YWU2_9RHOB|nr:alpha/beta hydrolase [Pseudosulfitobacter koreense]MCR8825349.1 alpha/beta hydrolase [Pseudosulfitobacter koreense]